MNTFTTLVKKLEMKNNENGLSFLNWIFHFRVQSKT